MLGLQPSPGLEQGGADGAADPGRERGRAVPAVGPRGPLLRAAGRPRRAADCRRGLRRTAEPQVRDGPLHRVQRVALRGGQQALAADLLEQPGAQCLQVRAAVEEEHLGGDHREKLVVVAAEPVAPAGQHRADPADLAVHAGASEDAPGQGEAAEAAEPAEGGEAAEQEGVRGQVRTHGVVRPARGGLAEPVLVLAQETSPLFIGPCPVGPAGLGAPQQHHRGRVQHRPAPVRGQRTLQRCGRVIERPQQAPDLLPSPGGRVVPGQAAQVTGPELDDRVLLRCPEEGRRVVAGRVDRPLPRAGGIRSAGRGRHGHRDASVPSPLVRAWTRRAWICCMPWLSFPASSRPDRWI